MHALWRGPRVVTAGDRVLLWTWDCWRFSVDGCPDRGYGDQIRSCVVGAGGKGLENIPANLLLADHLLIRQESLRRVFNPNSRRNIQRCHVAKEREPGR
jgi:hypothetical protein